MKKRVGEDFEKLVQLIENSIDPHSKVEHNVQMPILNSQIGATEQCDLVITSGIKPRQTITIVEVQDRNTPVKPNDFRGWIKKLDDVGAQHLVCVSRKKFSKSIREQASLMGNKVRLITVSTLDADMIPWNFLRATLNIEDLILNFIGNLVIRIGEEELHLLSKLPTEFDIKDKEQIFSFDKCERFSICKVCRNLYTFPRDSKSGRGSILIQKDDPKQPIYLFIDNRYISIGIELIFDWEIRSNIVPVSVLSYEQDQFGTLMWVLEGEGQTIGGPMWFKLPIKPINDKFTIASIQADLPQESSFTINICNAS